MFSRRAILLCWLTLPATPAMAGQAPSEPAPSPPPREVQPAESRLQFYGFVRQDLIFDDSRPDAFQTPLFILSEPEASQGRENFTMHPRLTRLGLNASGPPLDWLGGARISGKLEFDFQNGGRESRALPRYRHAYLSLAWSAASLLVGQTSDVLSPTFPAVNADTLMWNAGNLGDRRPQLRLTIQPKRDKLQWSVVAGAGLTGAVDAQDLDNDGVRDGEAAGVPNLQGRVGLSYPVAGARRLSIGLWGHLAEWRVSTPVAGKTEFGSHSVGLDLELPLADRGILRGEAWTGRNLSDFRGGIGQAVNRSTGEAISSRGGWVEAGLDLSRRYSIFVGYSVDSPDEDKVPESGRTRNQAWFVVNRLSARPLVFGIDYLHWTTRYAGAPSGTDNRVNAYVVYSF